MKRILISGIILLSVFLIYLGNQDKKIFYLSLGDNLGKEINSKCYTYSDYINDYLNEKDLNESYINNQIDDYRVTDLIKDINNNVIVNDKTIKNALIKSDLVTLSIGYNDIIEKLDKYSFSKIDKLIDSYLVDLEQLYKLLREYCKEDIIMIGYSNLDNEKYNSKINYLNNKTQELTRKYNIHFVDINDLNKNELSNNYHHIIFNRIRKIIDDSILN